MDLAGAKDMTKGGKQPGSGRPPADDPKLAVFQIRCTETQRQQIKDLGGAKWVIRKLAESLVNNPLA